MYIQCTTKTKRLTLPFQYFCRGLYNCCWRGYCGRSSKSRSIEEFVSDPLEKKQSTTQKAMTSQFHNLNVQHVFTEKWGQQCEGFSSGIKNIDWIVSGRTNFTSAWFGLIFQNWRMGSVRVYWNRVYCNILLWCTGSTLQTVHNYDVCRSVLILTGLKNIQNVIVYANSMWTVFTVCFTGLFKTNTHFTFFTCQYFVDNFEIDLKDISCLSSLNVLIFYIICIDISRLRP